MSLPKLDTPTYELEIPSTKKKIKFRPFLVKEEKNLLLSIQETDGKQIPYQTVKSLISSCLFDSVDVDTLTSFDIEWIVLQLRSKSRGKLVKLQFKCSNIVEGKECGHTNKIEVDIDTIQIHWPENHNKQIILEDKTGIGVVMKYPAFGMLEAFSEELSKENKNLTKIYDTIASCVDYIFDAKDVYKDFTKQELMDWVETLNSKQFKLIKNFFDTIPKLYKDLEITCQKCGHTETIRLEGLQSFLD